MTTQKNPYLINDKLPKTETISYYDVESDQNLTSEQYRELYPKSDEISVIKKSGSNFTSEKEGYGPMFNLLQVFQVLLNTPAGPVVETFTRAQPTISPDVGRLVMETARFASEHSNEITQVVTSVAEGLRNNSSSSASYSSQYRTVYDWWANGITGDERRLLISLGLEDTGKNYSLGQLKEILGRWWEKEDLGFSSWAREEWPNTFSEKTTYGQFLEFKNANWKDYVSRERDLLPTESKNLINSWVDEHPYSKLRENRTINPPKSDSPVWKGLKYHKNEIRSNGKTGKHLRYFTWDYTHNDIEVFDRNGKHLGSMDPMTGEIYKGAKPNYTIDV